MVPETRDKLKKALKGTIEGFVYHLSGCGFESRCGLLIVSNFNLLIRAP